jgi:hypothetical protein
MTAQPTLSQLSSNRLHIGFEVKQPLSHDQVVVSNHVLHTLKTPSNMPKTVQLIAQPQSGKTNTVLNMVALIDHDSGYRTDNYCFQPSDRALAEQLEDRFSDPIKAQYYDKKDPKALTYPIPVPYNGVNTPANIKGRALKLAQRIEKSRRANRSIVFIHDESHRDLGTDEKPANLTEFYAANQIMLTSMNSDNVKYYLAKNKNHNNEIYINISASPASFIEYMKDSVANDKPQFVQSYYLRPHANYLSFKDIAMKNRFKQGFEISNKKGTIDNVDRFVVEIVCQNLLLAEPGCLIVRLNPGADSDLHIREKIKSYNKHPELLMTALTAFLDPALLTATNIDKITTNLLKVNTLKFTSTAIPKLSQELDLLAKNFPIVEDDELAQYDENNPTDFQILQQIITQNSYNKSKRDPQELQLISDCHEIDLEIGTMDYFMKDEAYQQGEYRILFITNSFLQGKTFKSLNKVRGWFDRYNANHLHNNAFTIQSIGRNCGNHKNRNYTYPIWTNLLEIKNIIETFDVLEDNANEFGLIDPNTFKDHNLVITGTYTKELSKKARKEFFQLSAEEFCSPDWEAQLCSSRHEVDTFLARKLSDYHNIDFDSLGESVKGISVSKNNSNNVLHDILRGNYSRYRKDDGQGNLFKHGLIFLDDASPNFNQTWSDTIQNPNSPLHEKQGYFIAFVERSPEHAQHFKNQTLIGDRSCWKKTSLLKELDEVEQKLNELSQLRQQLDALKLQLSSK